MDQENYPELPRSQSCATLAHRERLVDIGRKQSDPTARTPKPKERIQQAVPIQEAQSYRNAVVTTLPPSSIQPDPSRHSAASLKVHFRSMDDVSEDCPTDCDHNNLGHSSDCPHQRILLGKKLYFISVLKKKKSGQSNYIRWENSFTAASGSIVCKNVCARSGAE